MPIKNPITKPTPFFISSFFLNPFRDDILIENEIEPAPAPSPFLERGDGE